MSLTERERIILQLSRQGLSDYRIARKSIPIRQASPDLEKTLIRKFSRQKPTLNGLKNSDYVTLKSQK